MKNKQLPISTLSLLNWNKSVNTLKCKLTTRYCKLLHSSAVARGGAAPPPPPPHNYEGNKSINRLEVTTDQCSAFDLDFFKLDNY